MDTTANQFDNTNGELPERSEGVGIQTSAGVYDVEPSCGITAAEPVQEHEHKIDRMTTNVGAKLESLAHTVRDKGPGDGMAGEATCAVAKTLERTGHFLEEHTLGDMADDMTKIIRRNPIQAVLIGIGLGFLLGRMIASRS